MAKLSKYKLLPEETYPADHNFDSSIVKRLEDAEVNPYADLARQCKEEFKVAFDHQKPKKEQQLVRLKLYNNQEKS